MKRKILTPSFSSRTVQQFTDYINEAAQGFADRLAKREGEEIEVVPYIADILLDTIAGKFFIKYSSQ